MNKKELEPNPTPQILFDNFNSFILNGETRIFNKLVARTLLYNEVKDLPGDIVECGVFKGTGIYTFLKLKRIFNANSNKRVIGFDFFNTEELLSSISNGTDKDTMNVFFNGRKFRHENDFKDYLEFKLIEDGFDKSEFELIEGDVSITSREFSKLNPGFKISLLYMDLDLEECTYNALKNLWNNVSKGGLIVFDEYAEHNWSESIGVDRFIEEHNLSIKILNYKCPTAYIKK